jgi:hypothetical protein
MKIHQNKIFSNIYETEKNIYEKKKKKNPITTTTVRKKKMMMK